MVPSAGEFIKLTNIWATSSIEMKSLCSSGLLHVAGLFCSKESIVDGIKRLGFSSGP